ncbi:MAG: hypothetical protein A2054_05755 [Deltaproteobacteria bacterium GWA2_55_10]|nr:MAG: hypothetical protein A2054_05755 [Deltaproteobacteria bacterium GWA2_55_10]
MRRLLLTAFFALVFAAAAIAAALEMPSETPDAKDAFIKGAITVKGEGYAPDKPMSEAQKRMLAMRAAKTTALREIAEVLGGVAVTGDTTVENAAASSDVVRTSVQGLVKGAQVIKEIYDPVNATAVVYVSVPVSGIAGALLPYFSSDESPRFQPLVSQPGLSHDGLIVDARGTGFRPALINRIITQGGEVLYDPSKAAPEVVAENGPAAYTDSIDKAFAMLLKRGSANPLVVKAAGATRATDAELGPEEASAVFSSNQTGRFFVNAKVVFVLN